jgi:hypothetical protein
LRFCVIVVISLRRRNATLRAVDLEFDRAQTGSAHGDVSSVSLVAQWYDENPSMVCAANPETRESYPVACIMWCVSKVVATNLP